MLCAPDLTARLSATSPTQNARPTSLRTPALAWLSIQLSLNRWSVPPTVMPRPQALSSAVLWTTRTFLTVSGSGVTPVWV